AHWLSGTSVGGSLSPRFYHYTNDIGFEALTSGSKWQPSDGFPRDAFTEGTATPVPGFEHLFSGKWPAKGSDSLSRFVSASALAAHIDFVKESAFSAAPSPGVNVMRDVHYGPGWYATTLPPETRTHALLNDLWRGDASNLDKTRYWAEFEVDDRR